MKAILITILFLGFLGAISAQWMDTLVDLCEAERACIQRLKKARARWGTRQFHLERQRDRVIEDVHSVPALVEPLNLSALFMPRAATTFSTQEIHWLLAVMGRVTAQLHPEQLSEATATALWKQAWQTVMSAHQQSATEQKHAEPVYSGRVECFQDLLAIPMGIEERTQWSAALLAHQQEAPGLQLEDLICIEPSMGPQALKCLPIEVVSALIGPTGMRELAKSRPEQVASVMASSLEGWQVSALHRIVVW